ncbi:hypothetical protein [Ewingella americana]
MKTVFMKEMLSWNAHIKIASASFKRGDLDIFTDQRDVTDTIKDVFEEYAGIDYCPSCNKND